MAKKRKKVKYTTKKGKHKTIKPYGKKQKRTYKKRKK